MGCSAASIAKIHLGVDPTSSLVVAGVVTSCQKHDSQVLGEVRDLAQPPPGTVVIGDGAYDRRLCYAAAKRHRVTLISRPGKRAAFHSGDDWIERNRSTEESRFLGSRLGKSPSITTAAPSPKSAMHRLKAAFGQCLRSRLKHNQTHEALLRAHLINRWLTPSTLSVA